MGRAFAVLLIVMSTVLPADAQPGAWPARPVTLVFPFAPGGAEGFIRVLAHALSERFGQPFIVEIRSGAGGAIGSAQVANAPPDGYTLLTTYVGPAVLNKLLYKSIPYDPDTEFEPVGLLSEVPQVIVSSPKLGFKTLSELIAYGKANPDALTVGHPGAGTMGHLAAALFLSRAGITGALVGYRGSTPAITDILSGHIAAGVPAYIPVVETVTRLAVTSEERVSFLPDIPTARESGIDVVASTWGAVVGPKGMPGEIVAKLNAAVNDFLASEEGKRQLVQFGMRGLGGPPERVPELMAREKTKWEAVIRAANIKLD
jgi:tripartite-type tricarboxylate transporter receptor subunit TctC